MSETLKVNNEGQNNNNEAAIDNPYAGSEDVADAAVKEVMVKGYMKEIEDINGSESETATDQIVARANELRANPDDYDSFMHALEGSPKRTPVKKAQEKLKQLELNARDKVMNSVFDSIQGKDGQGMRDLVSYIKGAEPHERARMVNVLQNMAENDSSASDKYAAVAKWALEQLEG